MNWNLSKNPQFKRIAVSFSGGRTSAVMTKLIIDKYKNTHEIIVLFQNTGWEHPATLDFVHACDKNWDFNTVWLEGVYDLTPGIGVRHKLINYQTAARDGEPFEQFVQKYGIPNQANPSCSARLKRDVQESYLKSIGWLRGKKLNYTTAIGIRADEIDRVGNEPGIWYPLVVWEVTKSMVGKALENLDWDLQLPSDCYGNCMGCFKKSDRKLFTLAKEFPQAFDIALKIESKYSTTRLDCEACVSPDGTRKFYRNHRTASDIIIQAKKTKFMPYRDVIKPHLFDVRLDLGGGCEESCEAY